MPNQQPGFLTRVKQAYVHDLNLKDSMGYIFGGANGSVKLTEWNTFYGTGTVNWDFNSWRDGYCGNEIVYLALRIYLTKFKVAPIIVSQIVSDKSLRKYESFVKSTKNQEHRITAVLERQKALQEIDNPDHTLNKLFNTPNSYQTGMELIEACVGHWKLQGNGYIYGIGPDIGNNSGKYIELHCIPSQWVQIVYSNDYQNPIKAYNITIDGKTYPVPPEKMFHIKDWNPANNYEGLSPLIPGRKVVKTDGYNKTAQARAFENGGKAYLLSSDSEVEGFEWTEEQSQRVDTKVREKLQGAHNYGNIFSVTRPVKVQAIGDTVADMGLIAGAKYNMGIISALFGVNDVLLNNKDGGTENNVAAAYKALVTNAVVPDQLHFMGKLRQWILKPYQNTYIDFDSTVYPELQPDLALMKTVYGTPPITVNEQRALFNYEALDDVQTGNTILVASSMVPLNDLLNGEDGAIDSGDEYGN